MEELLSAQPVNVQSVSEPEGEASAPPRPSSGRARKSPPPEDPAWWERQRRVEVYRQRLESGLGLFEDVQVPERPLEELIAEELAARKGTIG